MFIRLDDRGETVGRAIAPPSSEAHLWIEVAEDDPRSQLSPPLAPNWDGFFERFEVSDIAFAIMSSRSPVLVWLIVEFGKRSTGTIDADRLINYWNQTVLGMSSRLSAEQRDRLNGWAIEFRLPVRVLENSNLMAA